MDSPDPKPSFDSSGGWSRRAALRTYVPPALAVLVAASGQNFSETGVNRVQRQNQSANRQGGADSGAATGPRDQNVQARQGGGAGAGGNGPSGNGAGGNQPAAARSQPVQARQDGGNGGGNNNRNGGNNNNNNNQRAASQPRDNGGANRGGGSGNGPGAAKKNRNN